MKMTKKIVSMLLTLCLMAILFLGCALAEEAQSSATTLVAYFSATGHTKPLAEYAANYLSADLYEIVPAQAYTDADLDYGDDSSRTSVEQNDDTSRPEIANLPESIDRYDVIFLGHPIWWGQAPRIISTFLENFDFSGKTIVPFCTSGSSGAGSSARNLHKLVSDETVWLESTRFAIGTDEAQIIDWIDNLTL